MPLVSETAAKAPASSLVVFLKAPERSKRRLSAQLGDEDAAAVASLLLACALEDTRDWQGDVVLAPAERSDADWLAASNPGTYEVVVQQGDTLGARINYVDSVLRSRGQTRLIYIGADCPALDTAYLADAAAALGRADAVLGPASDGGVVLMAARRAWPPIGDLPWSTPALLDGLLERLAESRWTIESLAMLADIDAVEDLAIAGAELSADGRPARRAFVEWLRSRDPMHAEAL